jgi:hypothetical protein
MLSNYISPSRAKGRNTVNSQGKNPLIAIKAKSKELNSEGSIFDNMHSILPSSKDLFNKAIEKGIPFSEWINDFNNLQDNGIKIYLLKTRFETGNLYGTRATLEAEFHKKASELYLKKQTLESNFNKESLGYEDNNALLCANTIFQNIKGITKDTSSLVKVVDKLESNKKTLIDYLMNNSDNPESLLKEFVNKTVPSNSIYDDNAYSPFPPIIGSMTYEELFSLIKEKCDIIGSELNPETAYCAFVSDLLKDKIVSSKKEYKRIVNDMKNASPEAVDISQKLSNKDYNIDPSKVPKGSLEKMKRALLNIDVCGNQRRNDKNAIALAKSFESWRKTATIAKSFNLSNFIRRYTASNVSDDEEKIIEEQMQQFIKALRLEIEEFPQSVTVFMHLHNHNVSQGRVSGITPSNEMCAFIALLYQFMEVNIFDNKDMSFILPKSEVGDSYGDIFNKLSYSMNQYKCSTIASSVQKFIFNSILEKKYELGSNGKIDFSSMMIVTDSADFNYTELQEMCNDLVSSLCKGFECNPLFIVLYRCGELQTKPFCEDGNNNVFKCTGYSTITFKTLMKSMVHKSTDGIVSTNASVINIDHKDEAVEEDEEYDEEEIFNTKFSTFSEVVNTKTSKLLADSVNAFYTE